MPKKSGGSSLMKRLGKKAKKAHEAHKDDEIRLSGGADLPDGIEAGIAQLVKCEFGEFSRGSHEGEPYFIASGIVKEPKEHNGIPVEGLYTQVGPIPLCDTPERQSKTDFDDHYADMLNELRKLGVDTSEMDFDDLEEVCSTLVEEAPHFRFRTWKGQATEQFPNPRTNHDWRGVCEYEEEETDEVEEEDEEPEEEDEVEEEEDEEPEEDVPFGDDLDMLVDKADQDDEDAAEELTKRAIKAGLSEADIEDEDQFPNWSSVAEAIRGSEEGEEEDEEEDEDDEEDEFVPEKGDVFLYKPKGKRKAVEVEVTAVFAKKETANVKDLDTGKIHKNVPFSKLEEEE